MIPENCLLYRPIDRSAQAEAERLRVQLKNIELSATTEALDDGRVLVTFSDARVHSVHTVWGRRGKFQVNSQ